jgi:2-keto-4-pentenoate hydratase/2-oxohepta-3-ene-1,7-dioic acid hydratase in catechol pathway
MSHNQSKIICFGLNYRKHAVGSNMPVPQTPIEKLGTLENRMM